MALIEIYNEAGAGFDMSGLSNGYGVFFVADEDPYYIGTYAYDYDTDFDIYENRDGSSFSVFYSYAYGGVIVESLYYNDYFLNPTLSMYGLDVFISNYDLYSPSYVWEIYALSGDDYITGNRYSDIAKGGDGNDTIWGLGGNDRLYGERGADFLNGGTGNDYVSGGAEGDFIYGDSGNDLLRGGSSDDRVYGGSGSDRVYGDRGNDRLYGGSGGDRIYGGDGADDLIGNKGADWLKGGGGSDDFVFLKVSDSTGTSRDTIDGFSRVGRSGGDEIDLSSIDAMRGKSGNRGFDFDGGQGRGDLWTKDVKGGTLILGNVDGDRYAEIQILVKDGRGVSADDWTAEDFIL